MWAAVILSSSSQPDLSSHSGRGTALRVQVFKGYESALPQFGDHLCVSCLIVKDTILEQQPNQSATSSQDLLVLDQAEKDLIQRIVN